VKRDLTVLADRSFDLALIGSGDVERLSQWLASQRNLTHGSGMR
jgi:hypothetical protein